MNKAGFSDGSQRSMHFPRYCNQELGLAAGDGGNTDAAAMGFDRAFHDGEAQPGPFDFLLGMVFFDSEKPAENVRKIGAWDSHAVICDPDADRLPREFATDLDSEAAVRVLLERVFDEIEKDLRPVEPIPLQHTIRVWHRDDHFGVLITDDRFETFENVLDAGAEAEGLDFKRIRLAGFQSGNDEHVLHDARNAVSVFPHDG